MGANIGERRRTLVNSLGRSEKALYLHLLEAAGRIELPYGPLQDRSLLPDFPAHAHLIGPAGSVKGASCTPTCSLREWFPPRRSTRSAVA